MTLKANEKVRSLTIQEMDIPPPPTSGQGGAADEGTSAPKPAEPLLPEDDAMLVAVRDIMADGYAGAIFAGPPGTGKTWMARKVALALTEGALDKIAFVQFHPSYQYEDFIQGYAADKAGFSLENRVFALLCKTALEDPTSQFVIVIDEFSRTDVARVFGEALTYIETSKRGLPFRLQSGEEMTIPRNVFILATMNPWDRGVDDVDVALERRFATVPFPPSVEDLQDILGRTDLSDEVQAAVTTFFKSVQAQANPYCHIGHAYFAYVRDAASLERLWTYRLHPHFTRAARGDKDLIRKLENQWRDLVIAKIHPKPAAAEEPPAAPE